MWKFIGIIKGKKKIIDYNYCIKQELIELVELYVTKLIMSENHRRVYEPTGEIYSILKGDGLKVKYVESEEKWQI